MASYSGDKRTGILQRFRVGERVFLSLVPVFLIFSLLISAACSRDAEHALTEYTLPDINQLPVNHSPDRPAIDKAFSDQSPSEAIARGGHVFGSDADFRFQGSDGISYLVFDCGPFIENDTVTDMVLQTGPIAGEPFSYKIALVDHGLDEWVFTETISEPGRNTIKLPEITHAFCELGYAHLAVVVEDGAAIRLKLVQWQYELVCDDAVSISTSMLKREIAGVPVRIGLRALDATGRLDTRFNQQGTLVIDAPGINDEISIEFTDGRACPEYVFPATGDYNISVKDLSPNLDCCLGPITIYQTSLPVYSISVKQKHCDRLGLDPDSDDYQPAKLTVDGNTYKVGLRVRGSTSRRFPKRNWKLKLDDDDGGFIDREWDCQREIINLGANYKDSTMLHEVLTYNLLRELGVPAPRIRFVHLRINGVFQGVYTDIENPRRDWLRQNGLNDEGNLYKAVMGDGIRITSIEHDGAYYFEQKLGDPDEAGELQDLFAEISRLLTLEDDDAYAGMEKLFNLEMLTAHYAGLRMVGAYDNWYQNYYLYNDCEGTGKWLIFPWDADLTWGSNPTRFNNCAAQILPEAEFPLEPEVNLHPLTRLYHMNPRTHGMFRDAIGMALSSSFTVEKLIPEIDAYEQLIAPDVQAEWLNQCTYETHCQQVDLLKTYVKARCEYILSELDSFRQQEY